MQQAGRRFAYFWVILVLICNFVASVLGVVIYLWTLYLAYFTSVPALLGALVFPVIAQFYWIWTLWGETGTLTNGFTLACFAFVVFAVIGTIVRATLETLKRELE
jgi:uncharacterized membrane protein